MEVRRVLFRSLPNPEAVERRRQSGSDQGREEDARQRENLMPSNGSKLIEMRELTRVYQLGAEEIHALRGIDMVVGQGEYVAIMGPSGSGKSTLMNIIGCLDRPSGGQYILDGTPVEPSNDAELTAGSDTQIRFVVQT